MRDHMLRLRRLTDMDRARAVGQLQAGVLPRDVANFFNVHRSTKLCASTSVSRRQDLLAIGPGQDDQERLPSARTA